MREESRFTRSSATIRGVVLATLLAFGCSLEPPARSARLVSLSPSISQVLVEIGVAAGVVGVDPASSALAELSGASVVEGSGSGRIEAIAGLEPSLVLVLETESTRLEMDQLRARGIEAAELRGVTTEEILASYGRIGALLDRETEIVALRKRVATELAGLSASTYGSARPRVAWIVGRDPIRVVGGASHLHDLLEIAGGENPYEFPLVAFREVSAEELAAGKPDIVLDATLVAPDEAGRRAARAFWSRLSGRSRVEFIPPGTATLPSLDLRGRARQLHPKLHPRPER